MQARPQLDNKIVYKATDLAWSTVKVQFNDQQARQKGLQPKQIKQAIIYRYTQCQELHYQLKQ